MTASLLPRLVATDRLRLRAATHDDAAFILSLRLDPSRNQHLAPTKPDLDAQVIWMKQDAKRANRSYYLIEGPGGEPVGAIRLVVEDDATRQANERAWRFFEKIGAVHIRDEDDQRHYEVTVEIMRDFVGDLERVEIVR